MQKSRTELSDLPAILVGVSGEYFVAAELSRRGYVAAVTLRNTRGVDIVATSVDASRSVGIQVKANRGNDKHWMLNEKAEKSYSDTLFFVFVNLRGSGEHPDYHVVESKVVAKYISRSHKKWLATPGRRGKSHRDTSLRVFADRKNEYLNRWDILGL